MVLPHTLLGFSLLLGALAWLEPLCDPGHLGAVASESSVCSNIGIDILKEGGNAADAVCQSLVSIPQAWFARGSTEGNTAPVLETLSICLY